MKFSCKICENNATNNNQEIQVTFVILVIAMIHLCDCNDQNHIDYKFLQSSNDPWFCIQALAKVCFYIM